MENDLKKLAVENYKNGYSCSESIVKAAIDTGLLSEECLNIATSFSGGMSSGCLCGAVAGSQMVLGYLHGKNKTNKARALAKEFIDEFKKSHKAVCCKVLSSGFDFGSPERKANCTNIVENCAEILNKILLREESTLLKK